MTRDTESVSLCVTTPSPVTNEKWRGGAATHRLRKCQLSVLTGICIKGVNFRENIPYEILLGQTKLSII